MNGTNFKDLHTGAFFERSFLAFSECVGFTNQTLNAFQLYFTHNLLTIPLIFATLSFINLSGFWVLIHPFCEKDKAEKLQKISPKNEQTKKHTQARLINDIKENIQWEKSVTINQQFKHINFVPDHIEEKFIDEM